MNLAIILPDKDVENAQTQFQIVKHVLLPQYVLHARQIILRTPQPLVPSAPHLSQIALPVHRQPSALLALAIITISLLHLLAIYAHLQSIIV